MKKVLFPLKVQFTVDKVNGAITISGAKIKFNLKVEEYPELPSMSLINKMSLSEEEQSSVLKLVKSLLKKHLGEE